jgi:RNA polymerase sigma-B factor
MAAISQGRRRPAKKRRNGPPGPEWRVRAEDQRLSRRHLAGDPQARAALVERYLPLARALAGRYRGTPEEIEDLVQVASVGLVKAVDRWDPSRGFAFTSFAVPTILGELRRHLRDRSWCVRPPRGLLELCLAIEAVREELRRETGHEATIAVLAERLERSPAVVAEAVLASRGRTASSLDAPLGEGHPEAETVADLIGDADPGYARTEARVVLAGLVGELDDRERAVLDMRFNGDLLQSEIAAAIGCSQMHISRILKASLDVLHRHAVTAPQPS